VKLFFLLATLASLFVYAFGNEDRAYLMNTKVDNLHHLNAQVSTKSKQSNSKDILREIGIEIEPQKIVIDKDRVKSFFKNFAKTIDDTINREFQIGKQKTKENLGIRVYNNKVVIDLNKTKSLLEGWVGTLEELDKELTRSLNP